MIEHFTHASQELINKAAALASEKGQATLQPLHLFAASLADNFCRTFYQALGIDLFTLQQSTDQEIEKLPQVSGAQLTIDSATNEFLSLCRREAESLGDSYISLEHIVLCFLTSQYLPKSITSVWFQAGVTKEKILAHMRAIRKGKAVKEKNAENQYQVLERFCQNVTKMAQEGKLDPVIGRHEEIRTRYSNSFAPNKK